MIGPEARGYSEFVTVAIGGQWFGFPIGRVQDVFIPDRLTRVPLSPPEIAGILNLRGRIITAIDMRRRLDCEVRNAGEAVMAVGVDCRGESYGLLVDEVGEVLRLADESCEQLPANLDPSLARVATGVHRLDDRLLLLLDVDCVLALKNGPLAA